MDLLAHALYGSTICSKSGLAGGRKGSGLGFVTDWTFWYAGAFGIMPDIISMGVPFVLFWLNGTPGHFFGNFDENGITLYRYMHSMIIAAVVVLILRLIYKPLFVPSLAWPVHVLLDSLTHNLGKFRTTLFYPITDWAFEGMAWWRYNEVVMAYWIILPIMWSGIVIWRYCSRPLSGYNSGK